MRELRFNKGLSIRSLAERFKKSERTIYRWLGASSQSKNCMAQRSKKRCIRTKRYPPEVFTRIVELKKELPQRSAPMVRKILKEEFPTFYPSLSTVRKFVREQGLTYRPITRKEGYKKFARQKPNDLWQTDVAGVQTVGHLKQLYLITLIDDCSRFVVAAEYFRTQKGANILKVIRNAITNYGRPNQILADNGTQFRNIIGELGTKYSRLLEMLDVEPIFAKPYHPETKGKVERWFRTVHQMFLPEARREVACNPDLILSDFNKKLSEWVAWYNNEKPHWSLPKKGPPAKIYFNTKERIFRPIQVEVNWDKWLNESDQRKVSKYNTISYKGQNFEIPPGYSLLKVTTIEYEDKLEVYHKDHLITSHPYRVSIKSNKNEKKVRRIRKNGTISYKGKWYTIDYKLGGKTVEVQETNNGQNLLVYLDGKLVNTLIL